MNWGHWQYAPLWIVDYVIVAWLLWSFFKTRSGRNVHILLGGWAFTAGVFYMALFVGLDPVSAYHLESNIVLLVLVGFMLAVSVIGFLCALLAARAKLFNHDQQSSCLSQQFIAVLIANFQTMECRSFVIFTLQSTASLCSVFR